jgi:signal transduction histidine kinase
MKALPIRVRLTLWYFAMFATAACLLSAVSWWMLRRSVDASQYHDLQERAEDVQLLLSHEDPNATIGQMRQDFTGIYSIKDDGKWLQVMDQDGNWIFRSKRMLAQHPDLPNPDRLPDAGVIAEFHQGTRFVRILAYPIQVRNRKYSVQTGIALNKSIALLNTFGADLMLLTPAMIVLAAFGGHLMSRRALRPVALLALEARRINDTNLDIRLPVPEAQDEISDLSSTLNQMLQRIDKAFGSVRAFTGNASHELRTPISLLRTEIEVALIRPRSGEEYRATLAHLNEETVRMTTLVENLLSIARADAGAERVNLQPIELSDLFHRINRDWKDSMQLALLEFRTEIRGDGPYVLGDPSSLSRLLTILLENAQKYTPAGGSVVLRATSEGPRIRLEVRDTGVGISEQDLPHIYDRFFRGEHGGTSTSTGSGLGLTLGTWIAERHRTQLLVESTPGQGCCFYFSLLGAAPVRPDQRIAALLRAVSNP